MLVRRRLIAATWVLLTLHAFGAVLSAAQVCGDRAHTHAGVPAPDCAMHHQDAAPSQSTGQHHHHGEHHPAPAESAGGQTGSARWICHCSGDVLQLLLGDPAIQSLPPSALHIEAAPLDAMSHQQAVNQAPAPLSPPPR